MNKTAIQRLVMTSLCLLTGLFLISCTHSGSQLEDVDESLSLVLTAVKKSLPVGKREVSENGREFYSEYFLVSKGKFTAAKSLPRRKYAHIKVLGDRRPYTIIVEVIEEVRDGSDGVSPVYRRSGYDRPFSKVILRRIVKLLSKRRDNSGDIDDFRIF